MSRLLNRIARRRARPGEEATAETDAPLGPPQLQGIGERGRARRRLRYLRQVRELQLRDLGGFVLDLYRFGEQRDRLVREKLDRIIATDKESHAIEALLGEGGGSAGERTYEIRLAGVGGTCPSCGDFHASDARFCARCGTDLAATTAALRAGHPAPPPPEEAPAPMTAAAPRVESQELTAAAAQPGPEPIETEATPEAGEAATDAERIETESEPPAPMPAEAAEPERQAEQANAPVGDADDEDHAVPAHVPAPADGGEAGGASWPEDDTVSLAPAPRARRRAQR